MKCYWSITLSPKNFERGWIIFKYTYKKYRVPFLKITQIEILVHEEPTAPKLTEIISRGLKRISVSCKWTTNFWGKKKNKRRTAKLICTSGNSGRRGMNETNRWKWNEILKPDDDPSVFRPRQHRYPTTSSLDITMVEARSFVSSILASRTIIRERKIPDESLARHFAARQREKIRRRNFLSEASWYREYFVIKRK